MSDYGERKCLVCGKAFEPKFAQSVCCSPECQKLRNREKDAKGSRLRARVESCEEQIALLELLIKHLHGFENSELEELYKRLLKPEPEPEPVVLDKPFMRVCERMALRTTEELPCGKRVECFKPKVCKKVPKGATLIDDDSDSVDWKSSQRKAKKWG